MIRVTPQAIPTVLLVEPEVFGDARGAFSETYRADILAVATELPRTGVNCSSLPALRTAI